METSWIVLGTIAGLLLVFYFFSGRNSVWGGLTFGIVIGLIISLVVGFDWLVVLKGAICGVLVGFLADLLGKFGDSLQK